MNELQSGYYWEMIPGSPHIIYVDLDEMKYYEVLGENQTSYPIGDLEDAMLVGPLSIPSEDEGAIYKPAG